MTTPQLLSLLDTLAFGFDPSDGRLVGAGSILRRPLVQDGISQLRRLVEVSRSPVTVGSVAEPSSPPEAAAGPDRHLILSLCRWLADRDTPAEVTQLMKILVGSNTIKAPELRAREEYGIYRGVVSRRDLLRFLDNLSEEYPTLLHPTRRRVRVTRPRPVVEPAVGAPASDAKPKPENQWRSEPYFTEPAFDKLTAETAETLRQRIVALGLRRNADTLPAFIRKARERYPRSFEPWSKAEKGLLLEAICYLNRTEKLEPIFGRSARSLRDQAKRLIYRSKRENRVRSTQAGGGEE